MSNIKYHLITANFKKYDFHQLFNEEQDNNKQVIWKIGREDGKNAQQYNIGDIVYLYYSNLPDESNRLLMRAEVADSDTDEQVVKRNPLRFSYDLNRKIKGIWLKNIKSVALYDRNRFGLYQLSEKYGINSPQGQRYLLQDKNNLSKQLALIDEIENNQATGKFTLKITKNYFDEFTKCFFSNDKKRNHNTFISGRGVNFSEKHHFVLHSYLKEHTDLYNRLKYDDHNLIFLCPNCHRQLHHGLAEDVKKMLNIIYEKNKEWFDKELLSFAKADGYNDIISWIYMIYNKERQKNNYELLRED